MKIMVVDDEPAVVRTYQKLLSRIGHEVVGVAANGTEAVMIYKSLMTENRRPDVVLMDHRMPGKDGLTACREIIMMDPEAKVIIATADESIRLQALEAGAIKFKVKPFTPDDLFSNLPGLRR
jgi:two-component system chemotaxis response regulator CheY